MSPSPGVRLGDALITAALSDEDAAISDLVIGEDIRTVIAALIYVTYSHARMWTDICRHQGDDPLTEWRDALLEREARA